MRDIWPYFGEKKERAATFIKMKNESRFLGLDLPYTLNTLFFGMERYRKKGRDMRWENVKYFITKIGWPPFPFSETSIIFSVKQQYTRSLIKIVSFHRDSISPIYFYFSEIHYFWYVFGKIRIFAWNDVIIKEWGWSNGGDTQVTKWRHNLVAIIINSFTQKRYLNHNFTAKRNIESYKENVSIDISYVNFDLTLRIFLDFRQTFMTILLFRA